jgi:outer membrane protein OmpA-like peptidoglycan-associated protein
MRLPIDVALFLALACLCPIGCGGSTATVREEAPPPPPDRDDDGVTDAEDRCVCVPEDRDDFEDTDGCPEDDNDGDQIVDACDQCRDAPETVQGSCDQDGCPDRNLNCVAQQRIEIGEHIAFASGASTLDEESAALLEPLVAALAASSHLERVEIVGRATPREPRAAALTTARATAVRDALVAAGIDSARLSPRGLAPAAAAEGDALEGRYVDFVLVRVGGEDWPGGTPPTGSVFGGCAPPICQPVAPCEPPPPPAAVCTP